MGHTEARDTAKAEYGSSPVEMAKAAESLARTSRELRELSPDEWMDAEEAAVYLKRTPKTFRNIVAAGEIPRHYLTERGILFSRKELDEWLINR